VQKKVWDQMMRYLIKSGWGLCCAGVLGWWLYRYGIDEQLPHQLKAESVLLISIWMGVLTFPLGVLWFISLGGIYYLVEQAGLNLSGVSIAEVIAIWSGFVAVGYLQWFVLLPFIREKILSRHAKKIERP
jgi:energy-coupling factor transporter transmembrane protein EcfT